eukprot:7372276-Heterocapsa_arctica.AAC.1
MVTLGVVFDFAGIYKSMRLSVRPKPSHITNLRSELREVLRSNTLTSSHAARLAGKTDFVNSTLFGRIGRACLSAFKARQYQKHPDFSLTP